MEDTDLQHEVVITEQGHQIPIQTGNGVTFTGIYIGDDNIKDKIQLDISPEEFENIQKLAVTNDIPADILNANGASTSQ